MISTAPPPPPGPPLADPTAMLTAPNLRMLAELARPRPAPRPEHRPVFHPSGYDRAADARQRRDVDCRIAACEGALRRIGAT